jgi:hypothetical protein
MSPRLGQSDISKALLVSPVLDFLKLLMIINEAEGSTIHGDDQRRAEPSFSSPPMFLSDLVRATFLTTTANPDLSPQIEALKSVHGAFESAARKRREISIKSHRKIQELEAALREQSAAVDDILGHRSGEQPHNAALAAFQQTLFLQCPRGGRTAGHFRCVNRTDSPAGVDVRVRSMPGAEAGLEDQAMLSFEPASHRLAPQQAATFRASVDLSRCQHVRDAALEFNADVYLRGQLALKLFICVEIYDDQSEESEAQCSNRITPSRP